MFVVEDTGDDARPEGTRWVQRTTSVVHTDELCNEQRKSNTNGGDEGSWLTVSNTLTICRHGEHTFVLLLRQHEDRKHQLRRQNCLDEYTPRQARIRTQRSPNIKGRRKHDADQETRKDTTRNLRDQQQEEAHWGHGLGKQHSKGNRGVEQAARNAEEDPDVDHERETEDERNVLQDLRAETGVGSCGRVGSAAGLDVRDLRSREREE